MPNGPHNVDLTVDAAYNYSYSGGNQGNGNANNKVGQGAAPVLITLHAPAGFNIVSVELTGTGADQMSWNVTGNGGGARIDNPCRAVANVKYTVNVVDSSNGHDVVCDPKIVNT